MTSLLEFHLKVQGMKADLNGPLTVHCSAGIGRTGTFIALDYLMDEGLAEKSVDVNQCVARMRYERVNMVQAKEQYEFLHDIIAEWYFTKDTITTTETFKDSYKNMLKVEKSGRKNGLREIFDMMSKMCIKPNMEQFSEAMSESDIGNTTRVCTPVPGSTDYIAAVYMPSYMTKRAYIVTQTPTTNIVDDFWGMIVETNCQIIVSLDKDQGRNSKNLDQYFSPKAGQYSIHKESEENHSQGFYSKITCQVKSDVNLDLKRKIRIFSCSFWPSKLKVPKSSTPMICLLEDIATLRRASTNGPIVVHCCDGNEKSGVFCTLAAVIERIVQERSVRIIPTINQLRISRHEIITSYEQLKFCFDTIAGYLSIFSEYDIACY
ncbi:receptor-type tyrosine-protein phosphatase S isoform X2 [Patella vulgata]|nr:receptor-type tyrosine-protein phosphatase S isoform X2 [Patella vulgata]XP_050403011.1 receptor-type tyrosine-protein phosphatase S isoform X2 [Patella vulgata]